MGCTSSKYRVYPVKFQKSDIEYKSDTCIICLVGFENTNKVILPCGHSYHYNCILTWFDTKMDCPYCQKKYTWCRNTKKIKN